MEHNDRYFSFLAYPFIHCVVGVRDSKELIILFGRVSKNVKRVGNRLAK